MLIPGAIFDAYILPVPAFKNIARHIQRRK